MKPVINLDELELHAHADGPFQGQYGIISTSIGAKRLGYSLTICPPGKKVCPFHNHHINEEMFFILEGEGILRFGEKTYPLRKHDIIACPPGKREVAHQIENTGTTDLKYLALSTSDPHDICEYPDSDKIAVFVGDQDARHLRMMFKCATQVDYFEGEF